MKILKIKAKGFKAQQKMRKISHSHKHILIHADMNKANVIKTVFIVYTKCNCSF